MTSTKQNNPSKLLAFSVAVFALIVLLLFMQGSFENKVAPGISKISNDLNIPAPQTFYVEKKTVDDIVRWPGTVKSRTIAHIAPKMAARIIDIRVHNGDKVKQGDVLIRLDERDIAAQEQSALGVLAGANAQNVKAKADLERIQSLYNKEAATREHLDAIVAQEKETQAQVSQAHSVVNEMQSRHADALLRAPFDGVILKRLKEPGDMGLLGVPIITLQTSDGLRLEADVPTSCATRYTMGMAVKVHIDALALTLDAQIDEINSDVDSQTRTQLIKVALPVVKGLQTGYFGWLEQSCAQHEALLIPKSAIEHIGQLEIVHVLDNEHGSTRHIRTGKAFGNYVEVISGLVSGETIVSHPQQAQ